MTATLLNTRKTGFVLLFLMGALSLRANDDSGSFRTVTASITTRKEMQLKFTQSFRFPVLAGNHSLTSGNNLLVNLSADITPVSVNGNTELVMTPVAFLQIVAGGSIGSGWNISFADGLRINEPGQNADGSYDGSSRLTGNSFDGFVWNVRGGAAFQFDLAAIKPGDWNHVVFRTYHQLKYQALSSASKDESWVYENRPGEIRNGWIYYGNYLVGYQMPLRLSMIGLLIEEEANFYTTTGRTYWGDDVSRWVFGLLGIYNVTPSISITTLLQARTARRFEGDTGAYEFYQLRKIDADNPRTLEFYRLGVSLDVKL